MTLSKPARQARALKRTEATARRAALLLAIHDEVTTRAKGWCELCGKNRPRELHHVLGGNGRRRRMERPDTVVALCLGCHKDVHQSLEPALRRLFDWAKRHHFTDAQFEAGRRLNKLTTRKP